MKKYLISSSVIFSSCFAIFTWLLTINTIGSYTYISLFIALSLICLTLFFGDKIKEVNFKEKKIKMYMNQVEKVKDEIFATEREVRNIALELAETINFILDSQSPNEYDTDVKTARIDNLKEKQNIWDKNSVISLKIISCQKKLNDFLDILNVTSKEKEKVFKGYQPISFEDNQE